MISSKGRNVAWDYVLEKMNLSFKTHLPSHVTEARLVKFGVMINAVKHIRKTFESAWRRIDHDFHDGEGGECSQVEQADVGRLAKALNDDLGDTPRTRSTKSSCSAHGVRTRSLRTCTNFRTPRSRTTA